MRIVVWFWFFPFLNHKILYFYPPIVPNVSTKIWLQLISTLMWLSRNTYLYFAKLMLSSWNHDISKMFPPRINWLGSFFHQYYKIMIGGRWFLKILRKVEGGQLKYLFFLTRVGRWLEKGQNYPYVISEWSLYHFSHVFDITFRSDWFRECFSTLVSKKQNKCRLMQNHISH